MARLLLLARAPALLAALGLLLAGCGRFFFFPTSEHVLTPAKVGLSYEDVYFRAEDQTLLHAWFLPAQDEAKGTVFFLHGNAENISTHLGSVYWLPSAGYNVFLLDYRGYGHSEGKARLAPMFSDIETAFATLLQRKDIDPKKIVVFGQSLGGALAAHWAGNTRFRSHLRGVAIDSAFSSFRGIAKEKLGGFWLTWLLQAPLSWTVSDDYSPIEAIGKISPIPLLISHSKDDEIIPVHHGRALFEAAREPKALWLLDKVNHNHAFVDPENRKRLLSYFDRWVAAMH